jgi:enoyl-CoA hydratase
MLTITRSGGIVHLRMNHGKVNAMDIEFNRALIESLSELGRECEATLLLGHARAFSAGVDLKRFLAEGPDYVEPYLASLEGAMRAVFCYPGPIVAVIEGPAIAGGCMLACGCDYRLIVPQARIGIPELRIGVPLPMTAIEIIRSVALPQAFSRIVQIGATYTGAEAVVVGLADEVVDAGAITKRAGQVALEYTSIPRRTFELGKQQLRAPALRRIEANHREFFPKYLELWKSPAIRESISQYVEQRLR